LSGVGGNIFALRAVEVMELPVGEVRRPSVEEFERSVLRQKKIHRSRRKKSKKAVDILRKNTNFALCVHEELTDEP
jgi:hypothetical protein